MADEGERLAAYLAGRDVPCPTCGYNLRDLRGPRCPECGKSLSLSLTPGKPRLAFLLAGLLPLVMSAGFCVILAIWLTLLELTQSVTSLCVGAAILGAASCVWVWVHSKLSRWQRWEQIAAVTACWALATTAIVVLYFVVAR